MLHRWNSYKHFFIHIADPYTRLFMALCDTQRTEHAKNILGVSRAHLSSYTDGGASPTPRSSCRCFSKNTSERKARSLFTKSQLCVNAAHVLLEKSGLSRVLLHEPHSHRHGLLWKVQSSLKTNQSWTKGSAGDITSSGWVQRNHCSGSRRKEAKGLGIISFFFPLIYSDTALSELILQE